MRGARPEEPAPVTEDLSNLMEEKEADDEKVLTAVPGQAAPSPDEENMFIAKEPEPISSEDHVADDDFLEAGELASQEPSAGAHHESSEDETVSEETAFVESSPEEATDNIAPAVAFESEHFVENTAPESLVVIIPEDNATEETAVSVEDASPEDSKGLSAASIPVIPVGLQRTKLQKNLYLYSQKKLLLFP